MKHKLHRLQLISNFSDPLFLFLYFYNVMCSNLEKKFNLFFKINRSVFFTRAHDDKVPSEVGVP